MACNVYLTFFKQHDAAALRKLELRYLALCYGLPLIPAVVFLCIDTAERGKIFGSANVRGQTCLQIVTDVDSFGAGSHCNGTVYELQHFMALSGSSYSSTYLSTSRSASLSSAGGNPLSLLAPGRIPQLLGKR